MSDKIKVAFLGPAGTYSHQALIHVGSPEWTELPCSGMREIFDKVQGGEAEFAVIPVENSTAGVVGMAIDALIPSRLIIYAEFSLLIEHALMSNGCELKDIERLFSLPEPYLQCQSFVTHHLGHVRWVQSSSSSKALEDCSRDEKPAAAIGSLETGKQKGLKVLKERIQDLEDNTTRFFVVGLEGKSFNPGEVSTQRKSSMVFTLEDKPGSLVRVLQLFESRGLNMCHIESRPTRKREWRHYFWVSLEHESNDEKLLDLHKVLSEVTPWCRDLGNYLVLS